MPIDPAMKTLLGELGRALSLGPVELDKEDGCAFCFDGRTTVNLQYRPADDEFYFYADLGVPAAGQEAYEALLRGNLFWRATFGATLSLSNDDPAHVILAQAISWRGKTGAEFAAEVKRFANVAEDWLELIAEQPGPDEEDLPEPSKTEAASMIRI